MCCQAHLIGSGVKIAGSAQKLSVAFSRPRGGAPAMEEFVAALAHVKDLHAEVKNAKNERFLIRSTADVRTSISAPTNRCSPRVPGF